MSPAFSIVQHKESGGLYRKAFFNCGSIYNVQPNSVRFQVEDLSSLIEVIIPNCEKYPLRTKKAEHFALFCEVCKMIQQKQHKTTEGYKKMVKLVYHINKGGKWRKVHREP